MKKLLTIVFILIGLNVIAQQPTQRVFRATEKLQTDDNFVYQNKDIPVLEITYIQYSSDTTNWHNGFTAGDKYIRLSNDLKGTWSKTKLLDDAVVKSDSTAVFVTPKQLENSISSITVNTDSLVHKGRTETITGAKTFTADINGIGFIGKTINTSNNTVSPSGTFTNSSEWGYGVSATASYVAIEGVGTSASDGYGISGISPNVPIQAANSQTSPTGRRMALVLRGNSSNLDSPVQNDFGIDLNWYLPVNGWEVASQSEKRQGVMSAVATDVTQGEEDARFEWWLMKQGVLTKTMDLNSKGGLTINSVILNQSETPTDSIGGQMYYANDGVMRYYNSVTNQWQTMAGEPNLARTYSLTLPSASSVADRCSGAVEGTDYPNGWTIGAWSGNTHDIEITHNLNRRIVSVTVYSTSGSGDRLLLNSAAYTGVLATSKNVLRIEGLATVSTPIVINLVFN